MENISVLKKEEEAWFETINGYFLWRRQLSVHNS